MSSAVPKPNWSSLLSLSVNGIMIPFRDFSYTIETAKERIHLPNYLNAGWHHLPPEFSASFSVYAVKNVGMKLKEWQMAYTNMEIVVSIQTGKDWTFSRLGFAQGQITKTAGSGISAREIPVIQVDCEFLDWQAEAASS
jgi:hypothetical protein